MNYNFWDIVVVEEDYIWVVVKCWWKSNQWNEENSDVYVRSFNGIKNYKNSEIKSFIYSKELSEEEKEFYL